MLRIVALEKARIDNQTANNSRQSQANDAPVVARRASPPRFPPIHPLAAIGEFALDENGLRFLQQIFFGREKVVVSFNDRAAQPFGGKIGKLQEVFHSAPRRKDTALR